MFIPVWLLILAVVAVVMVIGWMLGSESSGGGFWDYDTRPLFAFISGVVALILALGVWGWLR